MLSYLQATKIKESKIQNLFPEKYCSPVTHSDRRKRNTFSVR